jgi:TusA-related sulfurtransferase
LKTHADATLDLRGSIVPVAMLEFTRAFGEMKVGGIMEVLVGDRETKINLFKVLRAYPYELLDLHENNAVYRVRLRKEQKRSPGLRG